MIKDAYPSISEMLETDYSSNILTENVPRTLVFGLCELKRSEGLSEEDDSLMIKPIVIKCFYIISLLLVGVGEIDQI